jgi:hypothetical protein
MTLALNADSELSPSTAIPFSHGLPVSARTGEPAVSNSRFPQKPACISTRPLR